MAEAETYAGGTAETDETDTEEQAYAPTAGEVALRDIAQLEIDVKEDPFQVSAIVQKVDRKQLIVTPEFQRSEVWKADKQSEFIESILLNYPLPPLFLNQDRQGRYIVVDGLQRTTTIYKYMKNRFALQDLTKLEWLNGLRFGDLDGALQSRIEDRKLLCYVLKPTVPMETVYDIFARINRGGMQLNRQEIRHALYQGRATALLKDLAAQPEYDDWIGKRLNPTRMGNQEAALRCVAFARIDPVTEYTTDMDAFLESAMKSLNKVDEVTAKTIRETFVRVFADAHTVLGEDAFRMPTEKTKGQINRAVLESIYRFLSSRPHEWVLKNAECLRSNYATLLHDAAYADAVRLATGDRRRVAMRFQRAEELLGAGCAD